MNIDFDRRSAAIRFDASEYGIEDAVNYLDSTGRYGARVREARTTFRNAQLSIVAQGRAASRSRSQLSLRLSPARGIQLANVRGSLSTEAANILLPAAESAIRRDQVRRDENVLVDFTFEGELVAASVLARLEYSAIRGSESTPGSCTVRIPVYSPAQ